MDLPRTPDRPNAVPTRAVLVLHEDATCPGTVHAERVDENGAREFYVRYQSPGHVMRSAWLPENRVVPQD